jgi:chitodextrinase
LALSAIGPNGTYRFVRISVSALLGSILGLAFVGQASAALTAPATLSIAGLKATSFALKWTAATGASGGIAGYDVYLDGALLGSTPATPRSLAFTGLSPLTTYSLTVVARDNSGAFSAPSTPFAVTTLADTTAPTRPTALVSAALTTTSFTLSWTAPSDNVGVTGYNVYRAGVLVGPAATTSLALTNLAPDTVHRMTVRALDAAGNLSAASAALNVRTLAEPPSTPTALNIANLKAASFTLKWTASTGGTGGIAAYEVYRDGVLHGTTTKKSYAFTAQTPLTTYSLTVVARDHEGRVSAPSTALSVSTPADTTKPTVPKDLSAANVTHQSFTLNWTPSTDNVAVTGYDVLRNNVVIGSPTAPPFAVTGLAPLTTYSMRVKAKDAVGNISGLSVILPVTTAETPNVPPAVTLTAPPANSFFTLPAALTLAATATDSDGTVALVEFFDGTVKLGETATPSTPPSTFTLPFTFTSPGPHTLFARATDNRHATVDSAPVAIRLLPGLPYITDFEEGEGYILGSLHDQLGWSVATGSATVTAGDYSQGTQSLQLAPGASVALADQEIGLGATNPSPVFVDVFAKPVAGATPGAGNLYDLDNARIAFVHNGTVGRLAALDGDGNGAGTWRNLPSDVTIDSQQTAGWLRLTARLDYTTKTWDLSLDGRLLAYDLKFRSNTATHLSGLSFQGHPATASHVDDLYAGPDNPLFTDADRDGMEDVWETAHGLNSALNDRNGDLDSDGLSNIAEYALDTNPNNADTDGDGLPDSQELILGTNPIIADTDGDSLPDGWEAAHALNPLSAADASADSDGDGVSNLAEFTAGTDPADYYNGSVPVITVLVGGSGQPGPGGLLQVRVANAAGDPLGNAPVLFSITAGVSQLAASTDAAAPLGDTLPVRTLPDGTASAYYRTPSGQSPAGTVTVQASVATATLAMQGSNPSSVAIAMDFEPAEGFTTGSLEGQGGWSGFEEAVIVTNDAAQSGQQSVVILPPPEGSSSIFRANFIVPHPPEGQTLRFTDLWIRAIADSDVYQSSFVTLGDSPLIAFVRQGATAELQAYLNYDDTQTRWYSAKFVPISINGSTTDWHRLTLRQDFSAGKLDVYLDGKFAIPDLPFSASGDQVFNLYGHSTVLTRLDHFVVTTDNPLFLDADHDGMDDAWETAHGLNPTVNDRAADPDQDGLTNIQEYALGSDPQNTDSDGDGLPDRWEVDHGLNPAVPVSLGQDTDADGLPDRWEYAAGTDPRQSDSNFNGISDADEDEDGDGLTALQEGQQGSNPHDFYNGQTPVLTPLADYSTQLGPNGMVAVRVTTQSGILLVNAPVSFATSAENLLTENPYGQGHASSLVARADDQGIARIYLRPAN